METPKAKPAEESRVSPEAAHEGCQSFRGAREAAAAASLGVHNYGPVLLQGIPVQFMPVLIKLSHAV